MYCTHKPGEGHQRWLKYKQRRSKRDKNPTNMAPTPSDSSSTPAETKKDDKKLTLAIPSSLRS